MLSIETALARIDAELGIQTERRRGWVHDELIRLWKVRGPFPGLGAVLVAFGISRGIFVAHALQQKAGRTIYWEHLGMLEKEDYRRAWEAKLAWYQENGVMPADRGGGLNGMLITTTESRSRGFDVSSVQNAIRQYVNG